MKPLALAASLVLLAPAVAFAAEAMPKPFVQLKVAGTVYKDGAKITARPGERLTLEANVYGGRRAWCLEPEKYANMGRNTVIESHDATGLIFTTGPGFRGIWKLQSEEVKWYGQLTGQTKAAAKGPTAELTVPKEPGSYILQAKASVTWHYDRHSQGNHVEQTEKNEAEGNYTLVVEGAAGVWFSSANITAGGAEDADIKFRLQSLQSAWDTASQHALDKKWDLVQQNLESMKATLGDIRRRLEQLAKEQPGFSCNITFLGLPTDKLAKRLAALRGMAGEWKTMQKLASGNAQEINKALLNTQMVFSNNILKSVVKNYLDWGSGVPGVNDLFGAVPTHLAALTLPSNILDWYTGAQEDASILKDQAKSIQKLTALREFYLERGKAFVGESKALHDEIEKNKPGEALGEKAKGILSGSGFAKWQAGR